MRARFPTVRCTVTVPLHADDELVGALFVHWTRLIPEPSGYIAMAEALGWHAAIAVRTARAIEEARAARGELEAVFEAAGDAILVVRHDGLILRANELAREWMRTHLGAVASTAAALDEMSQTRSINGLGLPIARGLAGESVADQIVVRDISGRARYLHVSVGPIRDDAGRVRAAVVVAREITELHESITRQAQLDGAIKTARRVGHELSNELALVAGYGELLASVTSGAPGELAQRLHAGAMRAAATLERLQSIIRFEEIEFGGQVMLDLAASTGPPPGGPTAVQSRRG
jgi:PAS domain-containing protein